MPSARLERALVHVGLTPITLKSGRASATVSTREGLAGCVIEARSTLALVVHCTGTMLVGPTRPSVPVVAQAGVCRRPCTLLLRGDFAVGVISTVVRASHADILVLAVFSKPPIHTLTAIAANEIVAGAPMWLQVAYTARVRVAFVGLLRAVKSLKAWLASTRICIGLLIANAFTSLAGITPTIIHNEVTIVADCPDRPVFVI